ncbi:adenylate kinase isoenzyme 6 [Coccinella septempunctata]|uniref:adenylate kinase isoenzyme 6 n=1 Tax=Coccinella septempunctata TaxID=41139 RepID=UPI001D075FDA|nr:adenylate kinase isoenzyme 6 [Coccinella septempunctata]
MEQNQVPRFPPRKAPNIMVTGTPGVGKSRMCHQISEMTGLQWIEISKVAKENNCVEEYDEVYHCPVLDEDKLMDGLEETMGVGGNIVDYHSCEFFPERWFDVVFVLRTDNTLLYDRLVSRGYTGKKLEDNMDCEIFQTILEEAKSSYKPEIVHELTNNTLEQLEFNVQNICLWIKEWFDHQEAREQLQKQQAGQLSAGPQIA